MHPQAEMFRNRLRKNFARLGPWARRQGVAAYRLYDRDIPEVRLLVDWYDGDVLVGEFARRQPRPAAEEEEFRAGVRAALGEVLGAAPERIHWRLRERQRGAAQYGRQGAARLERIIPEGGHRFLVNLSDYLDTGLFLDHRDLRAKVGRLAEGRRVLNLFAYTGSFTVYAARGGARASTTVDLSRTYLDWAARNFALNGLDPVRHELVRADVLALLPEWARLPEVRRPRFDLIVLDPPTFSNSKRMEGTLDVQRDHPRLLRHALALLDEGGVLVFSTNFRRFALRAEEVPGARFADISEETLPFDFRDRRTRSCYLVTPAGAAGGRAGSRRTPRPACAARRACRPPRGGRTGPA